MDAGKRPTATPAAGNASSTTAPRSDADRWLTAVKNDLNRGDYIDPRLARGTFATWASDWLATSAHVRPKTLVHYESMLRVHVLPAFADQPINAIGAGDVRRFIAKCSTTGAAPGTVRSARKVLQPDLEEGTTGSHPSASSRRNCCKLSVWTCVATLAFRATTRSLSTSARSEAALLPASSRSA